MRVMTSNPDPKHGRRRADRLPPVPSLTAAADDMRTLQERLETIHAATVDAVRLAGELSASGACERLEGLPLDHWLTLQAGMIGADRSTLITCGQVLRTMPILDGLFGEGQVSFGVVRNIAMRVKRRPRDQRDILDRRLGETARQWDGLDVFGPDRLLEAADRVLGEFDDPRNLHRREARAEDSSWVAAQPSFDGRVTGMFDLNPLHGATFLNGLDAATPQGEGDKLGTRRARGLVNLAECFLAGGRQGGAKPTIDVAIQLADVTTTSAGTVVLKTPGVLPTLSARLTDLLAQDADLRATIFDGARPLATSKKRKAASVPRSTRAAVRLRDVADRMPGSTKPIDDLHHLVPKDHHPDLLVGLSRRSHHLLHDHKWKYALDPATGVFTITRGRRTWRSVPSTTPLAPDPGEHARDGPSP
jgi:hypothetical protein